MALAAYVVARLVDTLLFLDDDVEAKEGFLWQREAVRRHIRDLPSDATETNHLSGIVDAVPVEGGPPSVLRIGLTAYAYYLEHESRLEEALEVLALAARTHGEELPAADFTACALFAGRLNRLLTRWDQATACYGAAEEAVQITGDRASGLVAKIGRTGVLRGLGNLPAARQMAEAIVHEAGELQLAEVQARGYGELSAVLTLQGLRLEALEADYKAFLLMPDPMQRMRTLGDLGIGLAEIGAYDAARLAFEIVVNSKASFWVRTNALIELMDLESAVGNRVAFERHRVLAETSRDRMVPGMATDHLFKTGVGLARFGQFGRAREALEAALKIAEAHGLNTWYFKVEGALKNLEDRQEQKQESRQSVELSQAPAIREMEHGLREYAALVPA